MPALAAIPPADDAIVSQYGVVADIRTVDAATIVEWKKDHAVRWWLELGDQLLLVGDRGELHRVVPKRQMLGELADLDPERLRLRARGCHDPVPAPGKSIARGGRWELRELAPGDTVATASTNHAGDHEDEWRAVTPNTIIARQYRLDAPARAEPDPLIVPIVASIDAPRWFADVTTLAGWNRSSYGTDLALSRQWIETQFANLGLEVSAPAFSMPRSGGGQISVNNVIGQWTGTQKPDEWIVVGAHYDSRNTSLTSTINAPGAEDNASGCAGVIELARALVAFKPERSIQFMCYAGEEQGLYGSKAHVASLRTSGDLGKVQAVVIMDMIGYSADATLDVLFESKATWNSYLARFAAAAATYVPALRVTLSTNPFGSDHVPYLDAGKQTLLAIENDWNIYPDYHKTSDTPANMGIHAQAMGSAVLKTNAAVLADLAGASDRIFADAFGTE